MPDTQSHCCPNCTSPNTARKESANKLGLTVHDCKECGAQFTLQGTPREPLLHSDPRRPTLAARYGRSSDKLGLG